MNWWIAIFALVTVAFMPGCSMFESKEEVAVTPTLAVPLSELIEADGIGGLEPTPIVVPRIAEAQLIGVIRELRANGCIIKKVANTDGIHYSQLVVTCGDPQAIPLVE